MKKIIIILLILSATILVANPIQPYVDIKELRFTDSGWEMELFSEYIGEETTTLDSCFIVCNAGSSYVQSGIEYEIGTLLVITQDDLLTPLTIDPAGDEVNLFFLESYSNLNFGSLEDMTMAPTAGQSLRSVMVSPYPTNDGYLIFARDNTPSIGEWDDDTGYSGIFCGHVYDANMNPVENVEFELTPAHYNFPDVVTDEDGYFEAELYAFNYDCYVHLSALAAMDTLISVAPGEENYYEFVFEDYVYTDEDEIPQPASKYHLSNYPNPFNPTTEISFVATAKQEDAKIVICNSRGQKIRELQIFVNKGENSVVWNGNDDSGKSAPSGVYLYKLVSQNKELATNKMLLLK
jgi:hypothetical protein